MAYYEKQPASRLGRPIVTAITSGTVSRAAPTINSESIWQLSLPRGY